MKNIKSVKVKNVAILLTAICMSSLARPGTLNGSQPLSLQVSPAMAAAPAFISVRAVIEVVAQSSDFFRSSRVELDGRAAPPLSVFQYSNLPPGLYEVSAFLIGTSGQRAAVSKIVKVVPR